ncbi:MAG: AAA family ATPase [Candidatus Babeliaceae bacterium]
MQAKNKQHVFYKFLGIILIAFTLNIQAQVDIALPHATEQTQKVEINEPAQQLLHEQNAVITDFYDDLMGVVKYLVDQMNANKLQVKNSQEVRAWLDTIKTKIIELKKTANKSILSETSLTFCALCINHLAELLHRGMESKFTDLPEISFDGLLAHRGIHGTSPQQLLELGARAQQQVDDLKKSADDVAFTRIQKMYHSFSALNDRYGLAKYGRKIGIATLIAAPLVYMLPSEWAKKLYLGGLQTGMEIPFNGLTNTLGIVVNNVFYANFMTFAGGVGTLVLLRKNWEEVKKMWPLEGIIMTLSEQINKIKTRITGTKHMTSGAKYREVINDVRLEDELFAKLRDQLKELYDVFDFYKDPRKYLNAGRKPDTVLLFTGPAGSGKSLFAKALSGEIEAYFREKGIVKDFGFINVTPEEFREFGFAKALDLALTQAPCVIFFDEFHLNRLQINGNGEALSEVLTKVDEINRNMDPDKQIIVIAATNRPELLDVALRRALRFTEIKFTVPNFEQRKHLLRVKAARSLVVEELNFDMFAQLIVGCSFADVTRMFEKAEYLASKTGITNKILYEALNIVIRKVKSDFSLTPDEAYRVAVHQAGCALAHIFLPLEHIHFDAVTIQMYTGRMKETTDWESLGKDREARINKGHRPKYGATFTWRDDETLLKGDAAVQEILCKIQLAGLIAQQLILGGQAYRVKDHQRAFQLAQEIVLNGLSMADLSQKQQDIFKERALQLVMMYEQEITVLLTQHKDEIVKIAKALQDKLFLTADEIRLLL